MSDSSFKKSFNDQQLFTRWARSRIDNRRTASTWLTLSGTKLLFSILASEISFHVKDRYAIWLGKINKLTCVPRYHPLIQPHHSPRTQHTGSRAPLYWSRVDVAGRLSNVVPVQHLVRRRCHRFPPTRDLILYFVFFFFYNSFGGITYFLFNLKKFNNCCLMLLNRNVVLYLFIQLHARRI